LEQAHVWPVATELGQVPGAVDVGDQLQYADETDGQGYRRENESRCPAPLPQSIDAEGPEPREPRQPAAPLVNDLVCPPVPGSRTQPPLRRGVVIECVRNRAIEAEYLDQGEEQRKTGCRQRQVVSPEDLRRKRVVGWRRDSIHDNVSHKSSEGGAPWQQKS